VSFRRCLCFLRKEGGGSLQLLGTGTIGLTLAKQVGAVLPAGTTGWLQLQVGRLGYLLLLPAHRACFRGRAEAPAVAGTGNIVLLCRRRLGATSRSHTHALLLTAQT
jgi:hypothetical protein